MNEAVTITMISSPVGAWVVTTGVIIKCRKQFGPYWKDWMERVLGFFLPIILVMVGTYASLAATGSNQSWLLYFLAFFSALLSGSASASDRDILAPLAK